MKKVGLAVQCEIVNDYYLGMKYKDIMSKYGINRWNIQDALSKFDMETDRISSPPRLPGGRALRKIKEIEIVPLDCSKKYEKIERPYFVLEDDLDIMERIDNDSTDDSLFEDGSYSEIDISENDEVRYVER